MVPIDLLFLAGIAFLAGFVDAVAGGGGLLQTPALFTAYPQSPPAPLFGTNKTASICGTSVALRQYLRRVEMPWRTMAPAFVATLGGAFGGAAMVAMLPKEAMRPIVLVLLLAVAAYTFVRKDFGGEHAPRHAPDRERALACVAGAGLGWYDGFFGPGTGSFFAFFFVRVIGFDFLHATAAAKILNFASNLAALSYFIPTGNVLWPAAAAMAVANVAGGLLGSRTAIRRGAGFVRVVFLCVLAVTIAKFGFDTGRLSGWW